MDLGACSNLADDEEKVIHYIEQENLINSTPDKQI